MSYTRIPAYRGLFGPRRAGRRVAAPWTPESLSNLIAWFDPSYGVYSDAGTTPAVADDGVYRWVSRNNASLYLEQTTPENRPLLKSNHLLFDGSNDRIFASLSLSQPVSFLMCARYVTTGGAICSGNSGQMVVIPFLNNPALDMVVYAGDNLQSGVVAAAGTDYNIIATGNGASGFISVGATEVTGNSGVGGINSINLGSEAGGAFSNCRIYEFVVTNGTLTADERAAWRAYTLAKYGA